MPLDRKYLTGQLWIPDKGPDRLITHQDKYDIVYVENNTEKSCMRSTFSRWARKNNAQILTLTKA